MMVRTQVTGESAGPGDRGAPTGTRIPQPPDLRALPDMVLMQARVRAIATALAGTEDQLADTFDRIAAFRPDAADRLRGHAAHARRFAAQLRQQADK